MNAPKAPLDHSGLAMTQTIEAVIAQIENAVRGHRDAVEAVVIALLAGGHILIEDVPGTGKTTLARTLARVCNVGFSRIQFTADMLPSDILGVQLLDPNTHALVFKKGPIFSQCVLADEINRASPRTQSALLEAMADAQVSVDENTHALPQPFCVIATQNPVEQHGAFPLPESQLDRFAISITLGYPDASEEIALVTGHQGTRPWIERADAVLDANTLLSLQERVRHIHLADSVAAYIVALAQRTRNHPGLLLGVSPRGVLSLASLCRARALRMGRDFATPDDVKALVHAAFVHRVQPRGDQDAKSAIDDALEGVAVPRG